MPNLSLVLGQLQQERRRLTSQLERLNNALSALGATSRHLAVDRHKECGTRIEILDRVPKDLSA